jgi:hypothetical protein
MTFDDDFCQILLPGKPRRYTCKSLGYDWPPPEEIVWAGFNFVRIRYSQITDEQREEMTNVIRGAEYRPKDPDAA